MSDLMLHGVLNMPLPDDPSEMGAVEWLQFRERARQASQRIEADADRIKELEASLEQVKREAYEQGVRDASEVAVGGGIPEAILALIEKDLTND